MSYAELRCKLAEAYGWTFADIDDMSDEQIIQASRGGKPAAPLRADTLAGAIGLARDFREHWREYLGI